VSGVCGLWGESESGGDGVWTLELVVVTATARAPPVVG
jgi:hypothetical protein